MTGTEYDTTMVDPLSGESSSGGYRKEKQVQVENAFDASDVVSGSRL
jgi:hypothetical protein